MKFLLLSFSLLVAGAPPPARAAILAGPIPNPANGHFYYLLTQSDWYRAEEEARALGGHLATIGDSLENDWVYRTFGAYRGIPRQIWIGLTDEGHEATVSWTNGEPVGFTNWYGTQPDNAEGREHCAHIVAPWYSSVGGQWNDLDGHWTSASGQPMHGVVEVQLYAGVTGVPRQFAVRAVAPGRASPGIARTPETFRRQNGSNRETCVPALTAAW